jgi:serine/threonine protein kinase
MKGARHLARAPGRRQVFQSEFNERFDREDKAVAALNHPGICTLHGIGPDYLIMELMEGKPVRGALPVVRIPPPRHSDCGRARRGPPQGALYIAISSP